MKAKKIKSRKPIHHKKNVKHIFKSSGYITFVLIAIALFAFLVATGFINNVNAPFNGSKYILVTPTPYGGYNSLELHTLNFITQKPTPVPSIPLDCGNSINLQGRKREPENVYSFSPQPGTPAVAGGKIALWYHDENAMTLGQNAPAMKNHPVDTIFPSQSGSGGVGDQTVKDNIGLFVYPSLYLLDLTLNPNGQPIDAIHAGNPKLPDAVYGTWKSYNTGGNPPTNQQQLPAGADPFPASGSVSCNGHDCAFGSEVVWNVNSLGLTSGHDYLAVFIVHDGDSDPSGSDLGTSCVSIHNQ